MTMITPSYLGETIEYSSLHACRSTLEDPTLGFVLQCVAQLDKLSIALNAALQGKEEDYESAVKCALEGMHEGEMFWKFLKRRRGLRSYRMNCFVHFFIDTCASVALLIRIDNPWIQHHIPSFLRGAVAQ